MQSPLLSTWYTQLKNCLEFNVVVTCIDKVTASDVCKAPVQLGDMKGTWLSETSKIPSKLYVYIVDENEPDADGMPPKNTAVDDVKKTHRRQSSLSNYRHHSLSPAKQGFCLLAAVFIF